MDSPVSKSRQKLVKKVTHTKSPKDKRKNVETNTKLDNWLIKKGVIKDNCESNLTSTNKTYVQTNISEKSTKDCDKSQEKDYGKSQKEDCDESQKPKKTSGRHKLSMQKSMSQIKLTSLLTKQDSENKTSKKNSLSESCDFPSLKIKRHSRKENNDLKKYGVKLPTVQEILQEKKELQNYKNILDTFQDINVPTLVIPTVNDMPQDKIYKILDCKDLPFTNLSRAVRNNLEYLKGIMSGQLYNERHEKFHNKNKSVLTFSTHDLTYNTSMVLFTFDQHEYMLQKLTKYLDPQGELTQYFFQVLLPELCLKIFCTKFNMKYEDAVIYLDKMPVLED